MGDYIALAWPPGQPGQAADAMREAILADGWRVAYEEFRILVCVRGALVPQVQVLPRRRGVLIGDVHDTEATLTGRKPAFDPAILAGLDPQDAALVLARCAWGRYVAVFTPPKGPPFIFRDPLGGLECVTWTRDEVCLVSSQIPVSGPHAPQDLAIDWARVEALLADVALASNELCLRGVQAVGAGVLRSGPGAEHVDRLWTPADHAHRARGRSRAVPETWRPDRLAATIDACVAALADERDAVVAEVSGGLDSAIVAMALKEAHAPVVGVVNHYWPGPEGDERAYAGDVAASLGQPLCAVARGGLRYDLESLLRCAGGPRPPFNAQDADYDLDMAGRLEATGGQALFTGHGGDAVFFQMPEPALARDILRGLPCGQGRRTALATLARRLRMSVWKLIALALGREGRDPSGLRGPSFLTRGRSMGPRHPWLRDLRGLGGAKRVQVRALTHTQMLVGDSLRGQVADLIHPLLCQPVVELCLSIPAPILAIGALDRPHARAAYADRLPVSIRDRRGKGDVTSVFARSIAQGLPVLAPFLMDGRLAAQGIIDPAKLGPLLDPEVIIWRDLTGEIMRTVFIEAWVRAWEARLTTGVQAASLAAESQGAAAEPPT